MLVTVDNGTGEPTSYNLDYSNPSGATTLPAPAPGPGPSEFRTMPAEQEMVTGRPMPVVEPGAIPRQEVPAVAQAEQYGATSPQASGSLSNDNFGGDAGLSRAPDSGGDSGGGAGLSSANDSPYADVGRPGDAGLSSAEDTGGGHAQPGMAGGMPMMGGAGGGGGGEDQQRTTTQWKTTGDLFDDDTDARMGDIFGERR